MESIEREHKNFVKRKFDRIVERYDLVNFIGSLGQDVFWRKKVALTLKKAPLPILDLCCGPFTLSLAILKERLSPIFALDLSFQMLLYGKSKLSKKEKEVIYPLCADAETLPFRSEAFGTLSIAFGLRNLPNKERALKEFYRVLKPGGILAILEFSLPKNFFFKKIYLLYLSKYLPFLGGVLTKDKEAYQYLAESIQKFPPPEKLKQMLLEVEFKKVLYEPLTFGIVTFYLATK
ncbi:MAG: ubiquinone/menaquinone biosynthesis methyltransferase [Thermodesulfobacteriaceae bacterium]|nr:ubiquinone/menaquinone biosynthesis methyltransferase [Thermodesulfobacteriaceae bacterium]MDW8136528.1 ubiquinone/menaquinone biosynthesis methyltransferase [Thermodesulfobacterium sp.]